MGVQAAKRTRAAAVAAPNNNKWTGRGCLMMMVAGDGDQEDDDDDDDGVHLMNPCYHQAREREECVWNELHFFPDLPLHAFFAMLYVVVQHTHLAPPCCRF